MNKKTLCCFAALSLGLSACGSLIPDISTIQNQLNLSDEEAATLQDVVDKFMTLTPEEQLDLAQSSGNVEFQSYLQEVDALPMLERTRRVRDYCFERPQMLERIEQTRQQKARHYYETEQEFAEEVDSLFELPPEDIQRELERPERKEAWKERWQRLKTGYHYRYEREEAAQEQAAIRQMLEELEAMRRIHEQTELRQQYNRIKKLQRTKRDIYLRIRRPSPVSIIYQNCGNQSSGLPKAFAASDAHSHSHA